MTIFMLISFGIAALAFGLGASKLFNKKTPLYFQLIVFAVGCFALEQLALLVNIWCDIYDDMWVGAFGIFGCNLFLLSANYGTLDKHIGDQKVASSRWLAFLAPVISGIVALVVFSLWAWMGHNVLYAVMFLLLLAPTVPASYLSLKYLLIPADTSCALKATRPCNVAALVFYAITDIYIFIEALGNSTAVLVTETLFSLSTLLLSLSAIRGAKQWEI